MAEVGVWGSRMSLPRHDVGQLGNPAIAMEPAALNCRWIVRASKSTKPGLLPIQTALDSPWKARWPFRDVFVMTHPSLYQRLSYVTLFANTHRAQSVCLIRRCAAGPRVQCRG